MPIHLTESAKQDILNGFSTVEPEPLDPQRYIPYDQIVISATRVVFSNKGKEMFYLKHEAHFENGELLTLGNISGYMPISLD